MIRSLSRYPHSSLLIQKVFLSIYIYRIEYGMALIEASGRFDKPFVTLLDFANYSKLCLSAAIVLATERALQRFFGRV